MGDYFKKEEKIEEKKEDKLITDADELYAAYDSVTNKIQELTTQGYEAIIPIRQDLMGGEQTPDDIGQIGSLRRRLKLSRLRRMEIGQSIWQIMENIEKLDGWSERYADYLEQHLDALQLICRSCFKMIEDTDEEYQKMKTRVEQLQEQIDSGMHIPEETEPKPEPLPKEVIERLARDFQVRYKEWLESDRHVLRKGRVFQLARGDSRKRKYLDKWFNEAEKSAQKPDNIPVQPPQQKNSEENLHVFSPVSPSETSEEPLLKGEMQNKDEIEDNKEKEGL